MFQKNCRSRRSISYIENVCDLLLEKYDKVQFQYYLKSGLYWIIIDKFTNKLTARAEFFVTKRKLLSWTVSSFMEAEVPLPSS
jgi:hypothetical protein